MTLPALKPKFTAADFLAWDRDQMEKHEYLDGEVFAMAGASEKHVILTLNVAFALKSHLRGGPCRVLATEMKLRVEASNAFYYPDILVTCDERDRTPESALIKAFPLLLVEVLSPSTAGYDHGAKFANYRTLETLREYVLIDSERQLVEVFRRGDDGRWVLLPALAGETVELATVGLTLTMADIYADTELAA
jgi:Uma2 family endonuclease